MASWVVLQRQILPGLSLLAWGHLRWQRSLESVVTLMRTTVSPLQINTPEDSRTQRNVFTVRVQWPSCARRQRWLNTSCFTRPSYCSLSCARWAVLEHLEWRTSSRPRGRPFPSEYKRAVVLGARGSMTARQPAKAGTRRFLTHFTVHLTSEARENETEKLTVLFKMMFTDCNHVSFYLLCQQY